MQIFFAGGGERRVTLTLHVVHLSTYFMELGLKKKKVRYNFTFDKT